MQLRMYRDYINSVGAMRFERPESTVYAARKRCGLHRQHKAMGLLRHLEVAPSPGRIRALRRLWVMETRHPPLGDFLTALAANRRRGQIELIRRLGATVGIVHSIRHTGTGDILKPNPTSIRRRLLLLVRKNQILLAGSGQDCHSFAGLADRINDLWLEGGGTLVGNWIGFPPVRKWDNGLMIMDMSRASYWEPLWDLVNCCPEDADLDIKFFWEYFLQGYCATCELPSQGMAKIEVLYQIKLLEAYGTGIGIRQAQGAFKSQWWKEL